MISVINVSGMNSPATRQTVCYVGRAFAGWKGHPLANPFKPTKYEGHPERNRAEIEHCLESYREWLAARQSLNADLAKLWEECDHGKRPLGCWCVNTTHGDGQPVCCHAQILAEMLVDRFASVEVGEKEEAN